jgi:membrane fusion protein (multidrug efflux system)
MTMESLQKLALASLFALTVAACQPQGPDAGADTEQNTDTEAAEEAETETATVRAQAPRRQDISAGHRATATLQAIHDAQVVARAEGLVREIRVEEGDRVEEGEVLAVLEDERRRLEVAQRRADLGSLEQELRRQQQLRDQNLVSDDAIEKLRYQVEGQRAALALAEVELEETRIKAPVDGVVSARHIRLGDNVTPGDQVFRVTDPDELEAEVHVPERLMSRLEVGQIVEIRSDAAPDTVHTGRVDRISPIVDATSGTVKATVRIEDGNGTLRPGTFARVRILYETRRNAMLVPRQALSFEDGRTTLFVVRDGVAHRREVTTGHSEDGWVEITEGLDGEAPVVTLGHATLRDGASVRINGDEQSSTTLAENRRGEG